MTKNKYFNNKNTLLHIKIAIIGAGSIGQLYLHLLKNYLPKSATINFYDTRIPIKPNTQNRVPKKIFSFSKKLGTHYVTQHHYSQILPCNKIKQADIIIICSKSYQIKQICTDIKEYVSEQASIILLVNGLGSQQEAQNILHLNPCYAASTTNGAVHHNHHCVHKGLGTLTIGPLFKGETRNSQVIKQLSKTLPNTIYTNNILNILVKKLYINAVINPLTALYQCKNGEIIKYRDTIVKMCHELESIVNILGISENFETIYNNVLKVAIDTKENYSSMMIDYKLSRKSEIDYILGALLQIAHQNNVELPKIKELYQNLKGLEND